MPSGRTPFWYVGRGGGAKVHGQRGDVPREAETVDPLPVLRSRTYRGIGESTQKAYAWDRVVNGLELVAGQSDVTHLAGM